MPANAYSFEGRNGTFMSPDSGNGVVVAVPLTGATITTSAGSAINRLLIAPAGTIATLTVKFPPNPGIGDFMDLGFVQIVTTLALQNSAGTTIAAGATAGAVGVAQTYVFDGTIWRKWR